ncbi:hypothetical protein CC2G_004323 [Coprinopsis cinerea AmutBmut pab1-1]|nr:hypothetical protein CC2G_004323 [Coprinopsis cinerea AmutBmut pab1-1]
MSTARIHHKYRNDYVHASVGSLTHCRNQRKFDGNELDRCDETYPQTFEFGEEDKIKALLPILVPGVSIPVPLYFASFLVSPSYIMNRFVHGEQQLHHVKGIVEEAHPRWIAAGEPSNGFYSYSRQPSAFPKLWTWPTRDCMIYFTISGNAPRDIEYFVENWKWDFRSIPYGRA